MKNNFIIDKNNFEETSELLDELFNENKRFRTYFWRIIMQSLDIANVDHSLTLTVDEQNFFSCIIHTFMDAHEKEQITEYYEYSRKYKPSLSECLNYLIKKQISNKLVINFVEIINSLSSLDGILSLLCKEKFVGVKIIIFRSCPPLSRT